MNAYSSNALSRRFYLNPEENAAEYVAGVLARRTYGRRGVVGALRCESWSSNNRLREFQAFIGKRAGCGIAGHTIRFTLWTE